MPWIIFLNIVLSPYEGECAQRAREGSKQGSKGFAFNTSSFRFGEQKKRTKEKSELSLRHFFI